MARRPNCRGGPPGMSALWCVGLSPNQKLAERRRQPRQPARLQGLPPALHRQNKMPLDAKTWQRQFESGGTCPMTSISKYAASVIKAQLPYTAQEIDAVLAQIGPVDTSDNDIALYDFGVVRAELRRRHGRSE